MKNRKERDPLGFWEISKRLWRENWFDYLILLICGVLLGFMSTAAALILHRLS